MPSLSFLIREQAMTEKTITIDGREYKVGQRVQSVTTKNLGSISAIYKAELMEDRFDSFDIAWDDGKETNKAFAMWFEDSTFPGSKLIFL